ncbi:MAG TPA: cob(I)yrinic acid a,c-diamide adenosyltransferase [Armatimonadota bacterium]|nr:cob(I)yrinic acid a,c-diamide adenosyltransferase [Armatimonadota bacterium]HPT96717.1 cob(I)yrinic acid a,c-diamide adenosyltransferase [Armatimonadota bacterium]
MPIYTRGGDAGETDLGTGLRVPKECARVEAYGTVDELNAHLGVARATVGDSDLAALLARVQQELFLIGADLAVPEEDAPSQPGASRIMPAHVAAMEAEIDRLEASLPPLRHFILPGGTLAAATLHVARCVCRRAERRVAALARAERVNPHCLVYLNRLSDLLFVMARVANAREGIKDLPWEQP